MENKNIYPEGVFAFKPNEKAPDFIKAEIQINARKFFEWLKQNASLLQEKEYKGEKQKVIRLTVTESKDGSKYNVQVNTYKPEPRTEARPAQKTYHRTEDDMAF